MLLGMFGLGAAYTVIARQTSGYTLAIGEGIRMRVGYGAVKSFLYNDCSFSLLASCLFCGWKGELCIEEWETGIGAVECVEGCGSMWRSMEG